MARLAKSFSISESISRISDSDKNLHGLPRSLSKLQMVAMNSFKDPLVRGDFRPFMNPVGYVSNV